jgi:hypothetical protein
MHIRIDSDYRQARLLKEQQACADEVPEEELPTTLLRNLLQNEEWMRVRSSLSLFCLLLSGLTSTGAVCRVQIPR